MEKELNQSQRPSAEKTLLVPTPSTTRWREFRITYLPVLVFGLTVLGIIHIWRDMPPATGMRGIGEGAVSMLSSPQDGFIQNVVVQPHGWVEAGQPILTISPFDPRSHLDLFQSQLQMSRLALEPSVSDRNALNYEQLRVDSLRLKQELAMARANLDRAEKAFPRHEELLKQQLLSRDLYDLTVRDRDFYRAEVEEKAKAIQEIDQRLEQLKAMSGSTNPGVNLAAMEILPRLENEMATVQTNWNPISLTAPISGEVNFLRQGGEFVRVGEPLLVINSPNADRVVAYLKQPFTFMPEAGMRMEVITRSKKPQRFQTEIERVGARVEIITNAIAYVPTGALVDSGLPLILPVSRDPQIRPGEIVDVIPVRQRSENIFSRLFGRESSVQ